MPARRGLLALLPLTLALQACGSAEAGSPLAPSTVAGPGAELDAYLSGLARAGRFTGSVLVARRGTVLLSKGYGLADEQLRAPNAPGTRFRIGSISKQFTDLAILLLQEQGRLDVQDSICLHLDGCPEAWRPVTIEQLMLHSSGIPDYIGFPDFGLLIGRPATVEQLIARFRPLPLLFPPGSRWAYSNSGYVLLGAIIERESGQSYAEFLQQQVFGPLGLRDSGYDQNSPPAPQHATGYLSPGHKPVFVDMSEVYAAGALYSTVEDLYRWDQSLFAARLVSPAAIAAMFAPHIPCQAGGCALKTDVGYGYGWFVADQPGGHRYVYHWGRLDGFLSSNGFYPQDDVQVIVLNNLESVDVFGISTDLGTRALTSP